MREIEHIVRKDIDIYLRRDLYEDYYKPLKNLMEETNASFFAHAVVKNYGKPGHSVSSFYSNPEWQEIYWEKYWDNDPVEKRCHEGALKHYAEFVNWSDIVSPNDCMDARYEKSGVKEALMMAFKHEGGILENMTIGWKDAKGQPLDAKAIQFLNELLFPLRKQNLETFSQIIS